VSFGADADAREEEGVQQRAAGGAASGRREERGDGLDLVAAVCDFEQLLQRGAVRSKAHRRKRVKQQPGGEGGRRLLLLLL